MCVGVERVRRIWHILYSQGLIINFLATWLYPTCKKNHWQIASFRHWFFHEGQCAWPSSEYVALFCALQVVRSVSSDPLIQSLPTKIFKAKENESFWRNYTISVKPDSHKPEPISWSATWYIYLYKITKIVRALWLVKNLWFIVPVNS